MLVRSKISTFLAVRSLIYTVPSIRARGGSFLDFETCRSRSNARVCGSSRFAGGLGRSWSCRASMELDLTSAMVLLALAE
ncbi:MAG: hypothetical protein ACREJD_01405 [Phycisphaerales bacterium]